MFDDRFAMTDPDAPRLDADALLAMGLVEVGSGNDFTHYAHPASNEGSWVYLYDDGRCEVFAGSGVLVATPGALRRALGLETEATTEARHFLGEFKGFSLIQRGEVVEARPLTFSIDEPPMFEARDAREMRHRIVEFIKSMEECA